MVFRMIAFNLYTLTLSLLFFGVVVPIFVMKFSRLGTMPEHWLNHGSFLCGMWNISIVNDNITRK